MKTALFIVLSICTTFSAFADTIPGVPFIEQEKDQWCWAAVSQCLLLFYIPELNKTQSEIAGVFTDKNFTPEPEYICEILEHFGGQSGIETEWLDRPLSQEEVISEADLKKPFIIIIDWAFGGGYHCVVHTGYFSTTVQLNRCMDPIMMWTFSQYEDLLLVEHGNGNWNHTIRVNFNPGGGVALPGKHTFGNEAFKIAESGGNPYISSTGNNPIGLTIYSMDGTAVYNNESFYGTVFISNQLSSGSYIWKVVLPDKSGIEIVKDGKLFIRH